LPKRPLSGGCLTWFQLLEQYQFLKMAISSIVESIRDRIPERSSQNDNNIFQGILGVIKTQWHLGFTAFGGPPVHFQIVGSNPSI